MTAVVEPVADLGVAAKRARALALFREAGTLLVDGLGALGVDVSTDDFRETPDRVARSYLELAGGSLDTGAKLADLFSKSFPAQSFDALVLARGIVAHSLCPHHLLPVEYRAAVGYIPSRQEDARVLGLSKLGRLVVLLAARPVLQEVLTAEIADRLFERTSALGVGVLLEGSHACMRCRGLRQDAPVVTSALRGVLLGDPAARAEFMRLAAG